MSDEYWIVVDGPRWRFFQNRFRMRSYFVKQGEYHEIVEFVDSVKDIDPKCTVRIGVTRGDVIYLIR